MAVINWFNSIGVMHRIALFLPVIFLLPVVLQGQTIDDLIHYHVFAASEGWTSNVHWLFSLFGFLDGDPERFSVLQQDLTLPWWSQTDVVVLFSRPLAAFSHWLDFQLWPLSHELKHVHSLLWYALVCWFSFRCFKVWFASSNLDSRVNTEYVAWLAALLFAFNFSHFVTVSWVANRSALLATFFGLSLLFVHHNWRMQIAQNDSGRSWRSPALIMVLWALCLASGEIGVSVGAFVFSYALFMDKTPLKSRVLGLAPYAVVFLVWLVAYKAGGYSASNNDFYSSPLSHPFDYVLTLIWRYPLYWLMLSSGLPSVLYYPEAAAPATAVVIVSFVWSLVFLWLIWPILARFSLARFCLVASALAILPLCSSLPHERSLIIATIGSSGILALALYSAFASSSELIQSWGRVRKVLLALLALVHLFFHPIAYLTLPALFSNPQLSKPVENTVQMQPPLPPEKRGWVVLNARDAFQFPSMLLYKSQQGLPLAPERYVLSHAKEGFHLTRLAENKIRLQFDSTFVPDGRLGRFELLFTNQYQGLQVGQRFNVGEMTAQIIRLQASGWPAEVDFTWTKNLDEYQWLSWNNQQIGEVTLPAIGGSLSL